MHTATSGPMMIFFFTVVTVILPSLVLAGIIAFAAHDARAAREVQGSGFKVPSWYSKFKVQSSRSGTRAPRVPRRIFNFLSAKFGRCS
jgi:hypothetical protein